MDSGADEGTLRGASSARGPESRTSADTGRNGSGRNGLLLGGGELGRRERVMKLARKDTLWYLCTVLHILFSQLGGLAGEASDKVHAENGKGIDSLLGKGVEDGLCRLVTRCREWSNDGDQIGKDHTKEDQGEPMDNQRSFEEEQGEKKQGENIRWNATYPVGRMDSLEVDMMLSVVERYWLSGSSHG
jgi:hypothetical protein